MFSINALSVCIPKTSVKIAFLGKKGGNTVKLPFTDTGANCPVVTEVLNNVMKLSQSVPAFPNSG
jgi:hypothetical protein